MRRLGPDQIPRLRPDQRAVDQEQPGSHVPFVSAEARSSWGPAVAGTRLRRPEVTETLVRRPEAGCYRERHAACWHDDDAGAVPGALNAVFVLTDKPRGERPGA